MKNDTSLAEHRAISIHANRESIAAVFYDKLCAVLALLQSEVLSKVILDFAYIIQMPEILVGDKVDRNVKCRQTGDWMRLASSLTR
jgi:hypothetical protein